MAALVPTGGVGLPCLALPPAWRSRAAAAPRRPGQRGHGAHRVQRSCCCARAVHATSSGVKAEPPPEARGGAASALDAAASTVTLLRAELPYVTAPSLLADKVAETVTYSFVGGLVTCKGRAEYAALQQHWRAAVPKKLGTNWKVRFRARACAARLPRASRCH